MVRSAKNCVVITFDIIYLCIGLEFELQIPTDISLAFCILFLWCLWSLYFRLRYTNLTMRLAFTSMLLICSFQSNSFQMEQLMYYVDFFILATYGHTFYILEFVFFFLLFTGSILLFYCVFPLSTSFLCWWFVHVVLGVRRAIKERQSRYTGNIDT